jgi:CheY-like chemotaxis protein
MAGCPARVLVVDDEPTVAELFTAYLADDFDVLTAHSGEAALDLLDDSVAVVTLDRRMPGLSGAAVARKILNRGLACGIVFVSAEEPTTECLPCHDEYLEKPVTRDDLRETVCRFVR